MLHTDAISKPTLAFVEPDFSRFWYTLFKHSITTVHLDAEERLQCLRLQSFAVLRLDQRQLSDTYSNERKDDPSIVLNEARAEAFLRRKRALNDVRVRGYGGGGSA
ncbi:hypothetical protein LSAT2_029242 [Lamellibrachia satsuma]|nr:hypothetical protein LSAT2_029242 [Lamellibrachia satsuma]